MIKGYLFINDMSEVGIDHKNNKYYVNADIINKDGYDYFIEVPKEKFIEILKTTFSWIPTGWDKDLIKEYNMLLGGEYSVTK